MNIKNLTIFAFAKAIFKKAPGQILFIIGLFFASGLLELFSIAAIIPVLTNLLNSDQSASNVLFDNFGIGTLSLETALTIILVFMSLRGILLYIADYNVVRLARNLEIETRKQLFSSILNARWGYLLGLDMGRISNIILRETERYTIAVQKLGHFVSSGLIATVLVFSSILVSWQIFVIFALSIVPYLVVTRYVARNIKRNARKRVTEANVISSQIAESVNNMKYIKASALEGNVQDGFSRSVTKYGRHYLDITKNSLFIKHFPEVFGVVILGALVFLSRQYLEKSPADLIFFLLILFRGYRQIAGVQNVLSSLLENIPSYETCEDMIQKAKAHKEKAIQSGMIQIEPKSIMLEKVGFSYDGSTAPTLENINIDMPEKGVVALVGMSGAGKTTIGDILLGLILPDHGAVRINKNKTSLSDADLRHWRRHIGYVPQDPFLITGTVRENILLVAYDKSQDNLNAAIEKAGLKEFVDNLENGVDTLVGDAAMRLSGGQRQRLSIARALAQNPSVLILDEATSALDNTTAQFIQTTIDDIAKDRLVIMITHRLNTIRETGQIYLMDKGKVIEQGTYQELLDKKDAFWTLQRAAD